MKIRTTMTCEDYVGACVCNSNDIEGLRESYPDGMSVADLVGNDTQEIGWHSGVIDGVDMDGDRITWGPNSIMMLDGHRVIRESDDLVHLTDDNYDTKYPI